LIAGPSGFQSAGSSRMRARCVASGRSRRWTPGASLSSTEAAVSSLRSPEAALLADVEDIPLGSASGVTVRAHLVIGWDEGRTSITDMGWDYLPVLGYAVRDPVTRSFVLHEERDGALLVAVSAHGSAGERSRSRSSGRLRPRRSWPSSTDRLHLRMSRSTSLTVIVSGN
jgi:hypothetical protein